MNSDPLPRRTWTAREISKQLGIPYGTTLDVIRRDMAFIRAGRHYLVPVDEFERYLGAARRLA